MEKEWKKKINKKIHKYLVIFQVDSRNSKFEIKMQEKIVKLHFDSIELS